MKEIPVSQIDPGRNVRFITGDVDELADSIRRNGIIVPLVVRKRGARYEIIAGHRRHKAALKAGLATVPATVRMVDDDEITAFMVAENVQRRDLSHVEIGAALRRMQQAEHLTGEEIARRAGKSNSWVSNHLRLMNLPKAIQDKVHSKAMGLQTALGYRYDTGKPERVGDMTGAKRRSGLEGILMVIVGLMPLQKQVPELEAHTDRDIAFDRRQELERSGRYRKVIVRPLEVGATIREEELDEDDYGEFRGRLPG